MRKRWNQQWLTGARVPQPYRVIGTPGQNLAFVLVKSCAEDCTFMRKRWNQQWLTGPGVPQTRRLVCTPGQNPVPVLIKKGATDVTFMLERGQPFASIRVPQPCRV